MHVLDEVARRSLKVDVIRKIWRRVMKAERNRNHQTLLWLMLTAMMLSLALDALAQTRKETQRRARPQSQFNPQLAEQIISIAREEGLDPLLTLEVMRVESGFNRRALSLKRAAA